MNVLKKAPCFYGCFFLPDILGNELNVVHVENIFGNNWPASTKNLPSVNISEDDKCCCVDVIAPGFKKEDFKINVEEDIVPKQLPMIKKKIRIGNIVAENITIVLFPALFVCRRMPKTMTFQPPTIMAFLN